MVAAQSTRINSAEEELLVHGLLDNLDKVLPDLTPASVKPKSTIKRANSAPIPRKECDLDALLEGADSWVWDDMEVETSKPITREPVQSTLSPPPYIHPTVIRCQVKEVREDSRNGKPCKNILVTSVADGVERSLVLLDEWQISDFYRDDILHVILTPTPGNESSSSSLPPPSLPIEISTSRNCVIVHPDLLISATLISQTSYCARRPIISSLVSNSNFDPNLSSSKFISRANVWGSFVHEIVQQSLKDGLWDGTEITRKVDELLRSPRGISEIFRAGVNTEEAKREILQRTQGIANFGKLYLSKEPKLDAKLSNTRSSDDIESLLSISGVHDIEEDMLSPTYGIKGKVDACLQVVIQEKEVKPKQKFKGSNTGPRLRSHRSAPLEIKTGRANGVMEHRAQTMLYTLLMAERYGVEVPSGLLYYTQAEEVIEVPRGARELRSLLVRRNELAEHLMRRRRKEVTGSFLPPSLEDNWACSKCYAVDSCMLYRKAVERVEDASSSVIDLYNKKTKHLTEAHCNFFQHWENLISLEEQEIHRFRQELWSLTARDRESGGRCFSDMVLADGPQGELALQDSKAPQYRYHFRRSVETHDRTLLHGHLHIGDPISLSIDPNLLMLARGFLTELTSEVATLVIDRELSIEKLCTRLIPGASLSFRIDKDELSGGIARMRENLALLFYANSNARRRSLLVDLAPPSFVDVKVPDNLPPTLNVDQVAAVTKVLSAQDYALILGMPGTGKTMTIATIIELLVAQGNTVVLASYTHSAVDNIVLKLLDADFGILRVGNADKVHPAARRFTLDSSRITTLGQYEEAVMTSPVVATTCLSIDHPLFSRRRFDYCIIDEASQITLPTCLGPLRFADKFVLVGDHFQLPPLVKSQEARRGGYDISLFRSLSEAHPEAIVELAHQYRMNEDIMTISNRLVYDNKLRCGSDLVARRGLKLPNRGALTGLHTVACQMKGCWIDHLLLESTKAIFVDTDSIPARETRVGNLIQNGIEASIVCQLIDGLTRCEVKQDDIGVVSLYRQQLKLITSMLEEKNGIELLTADKSQGRDKECIIISMVRSNDQQHTGDLLKDWRRINVAFTRARSKLVIFGSRKTLSALPVLAEFLSLMEEKGWILTLPKGAERIHAPSEVVSSPKRKYQPSAEGQENVLTNTKRPKIIKEGRKMLVTKTRRTILGDIVNNLS